jgi:hypothetical protein
MRILANLQIQGISEFAPSTAQTQPKLRIPRGLARVNKREGETK